MNSSQARFSELLNAYWLRPESAVFYAACFDALAAIEALPPKRVKNESLDILAMDGVPSAIAAGVTFGPEFDAFADLGVSDDFDVEGLAVGADPYARSGPFSVAFRQPSPVFSLGLVGTEHHAARAASLGTYERLESLEKFMSTQTPQSQFQYIWAINLYWSSDIARTLRTLRRQTTSSGVLTTILPTPAFLDLSVLSLGLPNSLAEFLDRGRFANAAKSVFAFCDAEQLFNECGFEVVDRRFFCSPALQLNYEFGTRPFFESLLVIRRAVVLGQLSPQTKNDWIAALREMYGPMLEEATNTAEDEATYCGYRLRPVEI